ncbi:hypothetical protein LINPERPRIM_LOCUS2047 [Linum perenne]
MRGGLPLILMAPSILIIVVQQ